MNLTVTEVYEATALDNANKDENGTLSFDRFNRLSKRAELRLLDYLSGDVANVAPPAPYNSLKVRDWLTPFLKEYPVQVENGRIVKPKDYYLFDSAHIIGPSSQQNCETGEVEMVQQCNTPIQILDSGEYNNRCKTFIKSLRPSSEKPIGTLVGNTFQFQPMDVGSIVLSYVRYPVFGKIVTKKDPVYNDVVIDEVLSTDYEWEPYALELLTFFITQSFSIHTREQALLQSNQQTGKLVRG